MKANLTSPLAVGPGISADERLDALLSITGRMDGFLYRCRNDSSYTMLYVSDGILSLTGYPPSDIIGNKVRDFSSIIHPGDLVSVYAAVDEALQARRNWNVDYRMIMREGRTVWVREIGGGVFSDTGELKFLEGFIVDISDRKHIEDLNSELLVELTRANEELLIQKREIEVAKQQSDHSANHDPLTDLPNLRAFQDALKTGLGSNEANGLATALLFIDLDRFKEVNDALGHEAGDELLCRVAARLRAIQRSGDFVARLGGDEFAFLLSGSIDCIRDDASRVAGEILKALQIEVDAPGGSISVGCTVGVALSPADAVDLRGLVAVADRLMYVGKKRGRNQSVCAGALNQDWWLPDVGHANSTDATPSVHKTAFAA